MRTKIRENYNVYYERKITNFIMLLNIVRSSVLKRHSYLYMARESEQRFDVSEKIMVFLFYFRNKPISIIRENDTPYYEKEVAEVSPG